MTEMTTPGPPNNVITIDDERIKETLNALLDAEAIGCGGDRPCNGCQEADVARVGQSFSPWSRRLKTANLSRHDPHYVATLDQVKSLPLNPNFLDRLLHLCEPHVAATGAWLGYNSSSALAKDACLDTRGTYEYIKKNPW